MGLEQCHSLVLRRKKAVSDIDYILHEPYFVRSKIATETTGKNFAYVNTLTHKVNIIKRRNDTKPYW